MTNLFCNKFLISLPLPVLGDFARRRRRGRVTVTARYGRSSVCCWPTGKQVGPKLFVYHSFDCDSRVCGSVNIVMDKVLILGKGQVHAVSLEAHGPVQFWHWCTQVCRLFT